MQGRSPREEGAELGLLVTVSAPELGSLLSGFSCSLNSSSSCSLGECHTV